MGRGLGATLARLWGGFGRPVVPVLVAVYVPMAVLLVSTKLIAGHASSLIEPIAFDHLDRLDHSVLTLLGLAGWLAAATVPLYCLLVTERPPGARERRLILGAAGLSTLFFADDLWQLHKPTIPRWTGLPSLVVLAFYVALVLWWVWVNRVVIARTEPAILGITLAFFAAWLLAKVAAPTAAATSIEAGSKLCAIAGWATYSIRTARSFTGRGARR